jgi:hypothetical protein
VECSFCLLDRDNDGVAGSQAYICRQCLLTASEAISREPETRPNMQRVSVHAKKISNPIEFVSSLGGLHDFRIDGFAFDTDAQTLTVAASVHFDGAPEYQGETPGVLVFDGVSEISADVGGDEGIRISNLDIQAASSGLTLEIDLNIGGSAKTGGVKTKAITAKFGTLSAFMRVGSNAGVRS